MGVDRPEGPSRHQLERPLIVAAGLCSTEPSRNPDRLGAQPDSAASLRAAVMKHLLDDLLAEAVDQPPARTRQGSGSLFTAIDLGDRDRLGGLRHHGPYFGVRERSP
jgi:hypothetical protein